MSGSIKCLLVANRGAIDLKPLPSPQNNASAQASIHQSVRTLAFVLDVDRQDAAVKLAGAFDAADHGGVFDKAEDTDVARALAFDRRDTVERIAPLKIWRSPGSSARDRGASLVPSSTARTPS